MSDEPAAAANAPAATPVHDEVLALRAEVARLQALLQAQSGSSTAQSLGTPAQWAMAVDLAGITLWRHDLATDRVHYNAHGYALLGFAPQADGLDPRVVRQRVHPVDLPQVLASLDQVLVTPGPLDLEVRFRRADGGWLHLLTRRVVQRDAQGRPVAYLGVALDATERLQQSRRADDLHRRFELVTQAAGIGHWSLERGAAKAHWSEPLRSLFGLEPQAQLPSPAEWFARWVHPADQATTQARFARWMRGSEAVADMNFRVLRPDGQVRQVITHSRRESGEHGPLLFGVVMDVTELRRAEQALRSAVEQAALAARGAGLGTWQVDLKTGATSWDAQMWALRGISPQPASMTKGQRLAFLHPDDRSRVALANRQARADASTLHLEFRVVWPDGQVRWLASRSSQVKDQATGTSQRIGVNWDITDSRTAAAVRQEREIALRESQSKSRFMARMSHELRTPLNAMLGFTQLMQQDGSDAAPTVSGDARSTMLAHVAAAGGHLLALIDDVLDLSSLQSGELQLKLEAVALAPLVAGTLPLLGPAPNDRPVQLHLGPLAETVQADAKRLRQVLLNLLSNAIKYNRAGGEVRVESTRSGAEVVLSVTDTGRGMSADQQQHLFEPFNRLGVESEGIAGSGIGLAIAKSLVERMGGSVHVRSLTGVGSAFELRLPAAREHPAAIPEQAAQPAIAARPASAPAPAPTAVGPAAGRRRRVLYIEDNPVNALIITELLARRDDLLLEIAVDGASGVAAALVLQPDLILLDMQLPDADGFEVLRRLRTDLRTAHIRCVALSANAMPQDIQRARQAGMVDYWTKPLDFKSFLLALDGHLAAAAA